MVDVDIMVHAAFPFLSNYHKPHSLHTTIHFVQKIRLVSSTTRTVIQVMSSTDFRTWNLWFIGTVTQQRHVRVRVYQSQTTIDMFYCKLVCSDSKAVFNCYYFFKKMRIKQKSVYYHPLFYLRNALKSRSQLMIL